jgi:nucleoside-diphosphate-sugar epimerase
MDNLDSSTVLVIGGNGFLGRHLLEELSHGGAELHAVSRGAVVDTARVQWWQGSASDIDWLRQLLKRLRPAVIYQFASASLGGQDAKMVLPTFEDDLRTTVNTLVAAHERGAGRVLITRSLDEPSPSQPAKAPSSPYAAAKAATGLYGRMFQQLYGLPVVMLRPFMTYGPGQKLHKVVPYAISSMLRGEAPRLSSGKRAVDWVYVQDVVSALVAAATRQEAIGKEIDVGSGELTSVFDVVREIQRLIPGAPEPSFGSVADRLNEEVRVADLRTAETSLGWRPTTPLRAGLSQTIEWYRARLDQPGAIGCTNEMASPETPRAH